MSLFTIKIEKVFVKNNEGELKEILIQILNNQNNIMAKIDELTQAVTDLQAQVDTTQAAIATAIAAFEQTIADLQAQIGNGGTNDAALQTIIDNVNAARTDLAATPTV